jgi:dienelactone hydrolase
MWRDTFDTTRPLRHPCPAPEGAAARAGERPDVGGVREHTMSRYTLGRRELLSLAGSVSFSSIMTAGQRTQPTPDPAPNVARRAELYALLGDLPDRARPVSGRKRGEEVRDGYVLEVWDLELNGIETVPAYLARPRDMAGRRPAIVFNHSHGGGYKIGKTEFIEGREYLQPVPYAKALTDLGYVALSIDHWVFGERSHSTELDTFKAMLWQGQVLWGMMVFDSLKAVDWLVQRPDVDPGRLGTIGMSMGSSMAQWLGALDTRIGVIVDICCLTDYHTLLAKKGLAGHGIYYYVPSLLKHFTASQINALMAPRPHLALAGLQDRLAPAEGLDVIDREMTRVYAALGQAHHWQIRRYDVGHQETAEGRVEALAFLQRYL